MMGTSLRLSNGRGMGEKPTDSETMILDHEPNTKTTLTTGSQAETKRQGEEGKHPFPRLLGPLRKMLPLTGLPWETEFSIAFLSHSDWKALS